MEKYEIMFIVKATIESEKVSETAKNFQAILTDMNAKVLDFKEMGE